MTGAGDLDRRVTILRAVPSTNDFNEEVFDWSPIGNRAAKREDVSDGERAVAGTLGAALMSRFTVRSDSLTRTITPKDRLQHGGTTDVPHVWEITGVKESRDGRRQFIEISATREIDPD